MVARIKALMCPQFFCWPKHATSLPNHSIARVDRMFFVRPGFPTFQPTDATLAADALMILRCMLALLWGLMISQAEFETFRAVRDLVQEALPADARCPMVSVRGSAGY